MGGSFGSGTSDSAAADTAGASGASSSADSLAIGAITFSGSLIAFAKLQEILPGGAITNANIRRFNVLVALVVAGLGLGLVLDPGRPWLWAIIGVALVIPLLPPVMIATLPSSLPTMVRTFVMSWAEIVEQAAAMVPDPSSAIPSAGSFSPSCRSER